MSRKRTKPAAASPAPAGPSVSIDAEVLRRIRRHARSSPRTEVCGVLIGSESAGRVDVEACIEAFSSAQASAQVTFTQDAWQDIYAVKDKQFPGQRIVGWYHSHPGFGIFLSEHDTFIQQHFFSAPGQIAWVFDPQSDEEGCFGWCGGRIERLTAWEITARTEQAASPQAGEQSGEPWIEPETASSPAPSGWRGPLLGISFLLVLLVGFLLGWLLAPVVVLVRPARPPAVGSGQSQGTERPAVAPSPADDRPRGDAR